MLDITRGRDRKEGEDEEEVVFTEKNDDCVVEDDEGDFFFWGGGGGRSIWPVKTYPGEYNFYVTRPEGEC